MLACRMVALVGILIVTRAAAAQSPIILRDLTVIRDATVIHFDGDGVELSDNRRLSWDEVLQATVEPERQESFNRYLSEIGLPIFRLKSRIRKRDWAAIGRVAEPLYQQLGIRELKAKNGDQTTKLICFGVMQSRLDRGDRSGAVTPFLQAVLIERQLEGESLNEARLFTSREVESLMSDAMLPIWFDVQAAESAFEALSRAFVATSTSRETGAIVYLASLAVAVKRLELARDLVNLIPPGASSFSDWRDILEAEIAIANREFDRAAQILGAKPFKDNEAARVVRKYLLAAAYFVDENGAGEQHNQGVPSLALPNDQVSEKVDAMLELVSIPAEFGGKYPALSAAALSQAIRIGESIGLTEERAALKQELLLRFPTSYHARVIEKNDRLGQN
jgi:hypothetical protein